MGRNRQIECLCVEHCGDGARQLRHADRAIGVRFQSERGIRSEIDGQGRAGGIRPHWPEERVRERHDRIFTISITLVEIARSKTGVPRCEGIFPIDNQLAGQFVEFGANVVLRHLARLVLEERFTCSSIPQRRRIAIRIRIGHREEGIGSVSIQLIGQRRRAEEGLASRIVDRRCVSWIRHNCGSIRRRSQ